MNGYKHAVTTARSRHLIVARYESGWKQQAIADSMGISRRTVCKWLSPQNSPVEYFFDLQDFSVR